MNTPPLFKRYGVLSIAGLCLLIASAASAAPRTTICHKPGTPVQAILTVAGAKLPGHYGHGDYAVAPEICDGRDSDCDKPIVIDNGVDCDDAIDCTVDGCAGVLGCSHAPDDAQCDDSNPGTADSCVADTGCVHTLLCGNGVIDIDAGEQCDDGNTTDGDGCSASCTIESFCGDGTVDAGEECDDTNTNNGDGCSAACVIDAPCVCLLEWDTGFIAPRIASVDLSGADCRDSGPHDGSAPFDLRAIGFISNLEFQYALATLDTPTLPLYCIVFGQGQESVLVGEGNDLTPAVAASCRALLESRGCAFP